MFVGQVSNNMKAIVVFESFWGNTAAIARAIAEGIGPGAYALTTSAATTEVIANADLIVAGAPLIAFSLPTDASRRNIAASSGLNAPAPDVSHPSMRMWLAGLAQTHARSAAFETRIWWSPGSAAATIGSGLMRSGCQQVCKPQRFIVTGKYGPLRAGELERAHRWGVELAHSVERASAVI